jgi:chromosome segregation ATPase
MNDLNKLTYDELFQINDELRHIIANLKKEKEEFEKCTARVYAPDKSYKDLEKKLDELTTNNASLVGIKAHLENKLAALEHSNELLDDMITPLKDEIKDKKIQLESAYKASESQKDRIKELENVITNQNATIHMAAGYISSTPQFKNQHPMNVLKWLRGINIT